MQIDWEIRLVEDAELPKVLQLAWEVFCEFEAPEYSPRGVEEFRQYVQPETFRLYVQERHLEVFGAFTKEGPIGLLAWIPSGHISLMFVEKHHHGQGVAKQLFGEVLARCGPNGVKELTVHSSPYAVPVYQKFGFVATAQQQLENGILYTPMHRLLP